MSVDNGIVKTGSLEWFVVGLSADAVHVGLATAEHTFTAYLEMTPDETERLGELLVAVAKHARTRPAIQDS